MAHFAIQVANIGIDLEDEDLTAKQVIKLAEASMRRLLDGIELVDDDGE